MRCNSCHTHLPEFGRFERRICPNCGMPVTKRIPADSKKKHTGDTGVTSAQDRTLWSLLALIAFNILILVSCFVMVELWKPFGLMIPICSIGGSIAAILFVLRLIRAVSLRAQIPRHLRDPFGRDILMTLIFGALCLVALIILIAGIHNNLHYSRNQDSFVQVQAVISEIDVETDSDGDETHKVYVSFSYDGQDYEDVRYSTYKSSMRVGDKLDITIDPSDPEELPSKGIVIIIVGAVMLVIFSLLTWAKVIKPLIRRKYV